MGYLLLDLDGKRARASHVHRRLQQDMLFLGQRDDKRGVLGKTIAEPSCNILLHGFSLPIVPGITLHHERHLSKIGMPRFAIEVPGTGRTQIQRGRTSREIMAIEGLGDALRDSVLPGARSATEIAAGASLWGSTGELFVKPVEGMLHRDVSPGDAFSLLCSMGATCQAVAHKKSVKLSEPS
jgi:hypothetical protein